MKVKWLLAPLFAASTLAAPAFGQISIMIGTPPPPVRYEVAPPIPQPGYVWVPGYWAPVEGQYVWYPGRWNRPPYYGAAWRDPRWIHEDRGWRYYGGGWGPREFHGGHREWHDDHREWHDDHHGRGHAYGHRH